MTFDDKIALLIREVRNETIECFVKLLVAHGLRVSDLLNVKHSDITSRGAIIVYQGKGSNKLIIQAGTCIDYILKCRESKLDPFTGYSRFFFYRLFKKYDIYQKSNGQKNYSVTHAPRKQLAQVMQKEGFTDEEIKTALGHKSIRSTLYYTDNSKRLASYRNRPKQHKSSMLTPLIPLKNGRYKLDPRAEFTNKQTKEYFKE